VRLESRLRGKRMVALLRRRVVLAAVALAAFATLLPGGWTASVHDGDGQAILLLAVVGMFRRVVARRLRFQTDRSLRGVRRRGRGISGGESPHAFTRVD
jgi:hypothetical protein